MPADKNVNVGINFAVFNMEAVKEAKAQLTDLENVTKKLSASTEKFTAKQNLLSLKAGAPNLKYEAPKINYETLLGKQPKVLKDINKGWLDLGKKSDFVAYSKSVDIVSGSFKNLHRSLLMSSLGIMFFGMAIRRFMTAILKSTLTTFFKIIAGSDELSRSLNPAYTALNMLGGAFEYLKFSVGQALGTSLEPFMEKIINLTDAFTRFTNVHPKLVTNMMLLFSIFGVGLFLLGTLELGVGSLINAFLMLTEVVAFLKTGIAAFGGVALSQILMFAGIVVAIGLVIWWINNFKNKLGGWKNFFIAVVAGIIKWSTILPSIWEAVVQSIGISFDNLFTRIKKAFFKIVHWLSESKLGVTVLKITGLNKWLNPRRYGNLNVTANNLGRMWSNVITNWQKNSNTLLKKLGISDDIAAMQEGFATPSGSSGSTTNNVTINAYGSSIASVEAETSGYMAMYQKFLNSNGYNTTGG